MWSRSTWPQPYPQLTQDEYAAATQMQHQLQMQANYQYWQSMQTFPPPQVQHEYGPLMPGMYPYPPVHQQVQQFSSNMNKSRKSRREKDSEQQAVASSYDASMTLHQIKGEFSLMLSFLEYLSPITNRPHCILSIYPGRIVKVAKNQDGSRFIQQRM